MSGGQVADSRVSYSGNIREVLLRACSFYELGDLIEHDDVDVGYEDYNVVVSTSSGKYFIKIFASKRTHNQIDRYVEVMNKVISAGINHPKLYSGQSGFVFDDAVSELSMVTMEYLDGKSLYDEGKMLNKSDLAEVLRQAALINSLDFRPAQIDDSWSIQNNNKSLKLVVDYLSESDRALVEAVLDEMDKLEIEKLPHCFVHGDLIAPNLIKANGKLYIVDFSVSNWYPRVQELAVIVSSGLDKGRMSFGDAVAMVAGEYVKAGGELSDSEVKILPLYTRAAFAAELLSAYRENCINGNQSAENEHWIELGRDGLNWSNS